jgi:hypothetical protein
VDVKIIKQQLADEASMRRNLLLEMYADS